MVINLEAKPTVKSSPGCIRLEVSEWLGEESSAFRTGMRCILWMTQQCDLSDIRPVGYGEMVKIVMLLVHLNFTSL